MDVRFLGHAAFALEHDGKTVLVDPFLTGNPKAAASADEVTADAILLTHGHADHLGDTVAIAKRTGATVVAIVELARELADEGLDVRDPNIGGTVDLGFVTARLTPAWHTSTTPKGTSNTPAGLVVELGGTTVYHLGDTGLFSDLALPARRQQIDLALMCIGGHYTMDRHDAVVAAELVGATRIVPCHYDTFPPIATDAAAFKREVEAAGHAQEVVLLDPGEVLSL
ncbi:metal-dependent hydrolase [Conexibacter sp. SYSU D00693]|uniref:metal-dependent hydrolase n=1 Tax=Conexibacter sp. SYSU D00693 TaxID=2812560 RepID=UPI00196AF6FE|nr:metal-dependent hydrolase [Conexibacter sp. SYSU D00693]